MKLLFTKPEEHDRSYAAHGLLSNYLNYKGVFSNVENLAASYNDCWGLLGRYSEERFAV